MTLKSGVSPINWNIDKSTSQNTEGELYLRIRKREIIRDWDSGEIISPKITLFSQCNWWQESNTNLCPTEAATGGVL